MFLSGAVTDVTDGGNAADFDVRFAGENAKTCRFLGSYNCTTAVATLDNLELFDADGASLGKNDELLPV